jgi:hypothetical protein
MVTKNRSMRRVRPEAVAHLVREQYLILRGAIILASEFHKTDI